MERFPDEQEIAGAISCYSGDIYDMNDVMTFLSINDILKPFTTRMIAWLVTLNLVRPDRSMWIPDLVQLSKYYDRCLQRYFSDCYNDPLSSLNPEIAREIDSSVTEGFEFFLRFATCSGIDEEYYKKDGMLRVKRIFATICKDSTKYVYKKKYQYIGYITYLISLSYTQKGGLPLCFAESIAMHLTKSITGIIAYYENFDNANLTDDHTSELKRIMNRFANKVFSQLKNANIDLIEFTRPWERCLFVEQHAPLNLLIIWDNLFFHSHEFRKYMRYLIVAHFRQMGEMNVDFKSEESINEMMWDASLILEDTDKLIHDDKVSETEIFYQIFCPCYPFMKFFQGRTSVFGNRK